MNNKLTIGIDHGYSMMKTPNFAFPAGLEAYDYEPYTEKNALEYGGMFYVKALLSVYRCSADRLSELRLSGL